MYLLFIFWAVQKRFEYDVGFQVVQDLVVTKIAEFWQIEDWFIFFVLVVFVVVDFDEALSDEIHFFDIALVANNTLAWCRDTAIHLNDKFVGKATLTLLEEMIERPLKFFEYSGILNQIGLHLWSDLLVELEFFDDKVEVIEECLLNILSNIIIQRWLNMIWLV